ncbi:MAG: TIGR00303 family protein [Candidatus Bathyarchaeota archaeon]|uniref:nicotinate mononucleotide-dependent phosphoribosyltransferase CobT n=1 Tax=Candidatus Bathycorpusculum sp. TaxID=2994959 RepID=UPI002819401A|nr:TIGR00303 family protein [Candidatus Termiticorpusculum sp.]MCL2256593.1 TIGR00303 family protein [Candidatus Termiticorpusculum sp.]MCL2293215.1 TIGR00303 family protein [Candidatus Termiticorpusculum sp.]
MKTNFDIILAHNKVKAEAFLLEIEDKNPLFIATIATTETGKIPGLSAAGQNPDFTDFTPPADAELLLLGKCKSIQGVPITPDGIPTPGLIAMSALNLADIPVVIVNAGCKVKPQVPFIELGGNSGRDIRSGNSVDNVEEVIERAKTAGHQLAKTSDYLVIGESIPGGTTTALGLLSALGVNATGKVSSTLPLNPHDLKVDVVQTGLKAAGEKFGSLNNNPIKAVSCVGDPMMPALAGLAMGAANQVPVLLAGGTQMTAVLALINALNPDVLCNIAVGTTRWVTNDTTSDIRGIINQFCEVPILAADLNFGSSKFPGLQIYETGLVKEGVGAGGASIAAMAKMGNAVNKELLLKAIERNYSVLMSMK